MPCGRCRQLLYEHGGRELLLLRPSRAISRMAEVLPDAFGPDDLTHVAWPTERPMSRTTPSR